MNGRFATIIIALFLSNRRNRADYKEQTPFCERHCTSKQISLMIISMCPSWKIFSTWHCLLFFVVKVLCLLVFACVLNINSRLISYVSSEPSDLDWFIRFHGHWFLIFWFLASYWFLVFIHFHGHWFLIFLFLAFFWFLMFWFWFLTDFSYLFLSWFLVFIPDIFLISHVFDLLISLVLW